MGPLITNGNAHTTSMQHSCSLIKVRLHDVSNVGSNVGSKRLGQYGANAGANVGGVGCRLHDASNSPILEVNIRQ